MKKPKTAPGTALSDRDTASIAELWARFVVNEYYVPLMLGMPESSWDLYKRTSSPRIFNIGKRRFVLIDDLKEWLRATRDHGHAAPANRLPRVCNDE